MVDLKDEVSEIGKEKEGAVMETVCVPSYNRNRPCLINLNAVLYEVLLVNPKPELYNRFPKELRSVPRSPAPGWRIWSFCIALRPFHHPEGNSGIWVQRPK